jgi:hypothetical protein
LPAGALPGRRALIADAFVLCGVLFCQVVADWWCLLGFIYGAR